tara:strand:- start:332 stop:541 length:210 start_codon:yes stop_codon:yes gene_type:complete
MLKYISWSGLYGFSGSLIYITIKDIYNMNKNEKTDLNYISNFINSGFYVGLFLGLLRAYKSHSLLLKNT